MSEGGSLEILRNIASASHRVIIAAKKHADCKSLFIKSVQFTLEMEMQRIHVACECLASSLPMLFPGGLAFDERVMDWLTSEEPRMCSKALDQMERVLQEDATLLMPTSLMVGHVADTHDKFNEAVNLFNSRKRYFHFLFYIWNCEVIMEQQVDVLNTAVPRETIHDGGYADTKRRSDVTAGEEEGEERELEEILKWLDALDCTEKQDGTLPLHTRQWLIDTTQYMAWRNSKSDKGPFLWLKGQPGSGKSVLASSVINSLQVSRHDEELLAFFYCDFRNERSTHSAEVMRSILSQLLRQLRGGGVHLGSRLYDLIKEKERDDATLNNAEELAKFACNIVGLLSLKPLVIVDALDECKDVKKLLQALLVIKSRVRLFVTSRPLFVVQDYLDGLPSVSLDRTASGLLSDIQLHVSRELDARQRFRSFDKDFKPEIVFVLSTKGGGTFRWVQCSIDMLLRCVIMKEVRNTLNNLPEGLNETYERILIGIDTDVWKSQFVKRALLWLVAAPRPLYLDELVEGVLINFSSRTLDSDFGPMHSYILLEACGSLVTYVERTGLITLSHFSVQQYLLNHTALSQYRINWQSTQLHLARSCLCYISICLGHPQVPGRPRNLVSHVRDASRERRSLVSQPLRDYALDHALDHLSRSGALIVSILPDINVLERDVLAHFETWDNMWPSAKQVRRRTMPSWPMSRHDFLLYVLVALGPNSSLLHFLCHTTRKPKEGNNPLIYAAYFNKYEHALTLLSRGARLDCKGWEVVRFCQALPIEVALQSGHSDIVTLFVRAGSPIPPHLFTVVYDRYHTKISSTAMKSLLQTDSFVESAAETFLTGFVSRPLAFLDHFLKNDPVAEEDLIDCIRRMVQIGYDPFAATSCQNSLLRIIVQHGHVAVARYLLSLGMSLPDDSLVTLNLWSMRNGVRMVHFLVESGADTLARTSNGDSVLHLVLAAFDERDALETTKLLVDHHCDPSSPNSRGETPIRIAVCQGHVSVTGYLLSLGVRLPPDLLVTPGLWRMKNGTRMIRCLVGNGTNALAHINNGDSLLHAMLATFDEHDALETAQFLVAHGFDPLKFNSHGETPIHIAVERGHVSVMGYLLSVGAPLPYDALFVALHSPRLQGASLRRSKVIHLLVDQGANILARRSNGDSVLHSAITTFPIGDPGVLNFMELVVARGFDLGIANIHGVTPLHSAVRRGDVNIVKRLLSYHAPLPPDILFIAMQSDSISSLQMMGVIENLVTFGCDPLVRNKAGYTPLHVATLKGYLGVVGYLLSILDSPPAEDLVSAAMLVPPGMQGRIIRSMLESALRGLKSSKNHVL